MACSSGKKIKNNSLLSMGYSKSDADCAIRVSIGEATKKGFRKICKCMVSYNKKR